MSFVAILSVINHPAPAVHQTNPWAQHSPAHGTSTPQKPESYQVSQPTNPFLMPTSSNSPAPSTGSPSAINLTNKPLLQHTRSHSMDSGNVSPWQQQQQHAKKQTLLEMAHHQSFQLNGSSGDDQNWGTSTDWSAPYVQTSQQISNSTDTQQVANNTSTKTGSEDTFDPFDVAWAAKNGGKVEANPQTNNVSNPFATKTVTTYKVEL